jgi:hypothetical protein
MRSLRDPRLFLLAVTACFLVACFIGRRTDDLECNTSAECEAGRGCFEGYCVVPTCPAGCACTTLLPDRSGYADCTINCSGNRCRNSAIACPPGMACRIMCGSTDDCRSVDCSQAKSCEVTCSGNSSCDQVTCGSGRCDVTCSGIGSCEDGVSCGASCGCDVRCTGNNSCATQASCPPAAGCDTGLGCTSLPAGTCNTCS